MKLCATGLALVMAVAVAVAVAGCEAAEKEQESAETVLVPAESAGAEVSETEEQVVEPQISEAFATPWPSGFSRKELADTAIAKTYAYFDQREVGASERLLTIVHQETIPEFHRVWTEDLAKLTVDAFAGFLDEEVLLVTGTDVEFLEDSLESIGKPLHPGGVDASSGYACVAYQGWTYVSLSAFSSESMPGGNFTACVPHEIFHLVQDSLDKAPSSQVFPPGHELYRAHWFVEGSAQYVGHALASYQDYYPYWGMHESMTISDLRAEQPYLKAYESWEGGWGSYRWGHLATEYIVASKGMEGLMEVWVLLGSGATFEEAFEGALDVSVSDFYAAFDRMNQEMR